MSERKRGEDAMGQHEIAAHEKCDGNCEVARLLVHLDESRKIALEEGTRARRAEAKEGPLRSAMEQVRGHVATLVEQYGKTTGGQMYVRDLARIDAALNATVSVGVLIDGALFEQEPSDKERWFTGRLPCKCGVVCFVSEPAYSYWNPLRRLDGSRHAPTGCTQAKPPPGATP